MGAGSQAQTFLARDERDHSRIVVVKVLKLGGETGWKKFDLFEREVRVLKAIKHPAVPRYIDSFEGERGTFYLLMERAPGATLRAIATRARFSELDLLEILVKTLGVLKYLHEQDPPVIHRDIKPANLLRDARGRISVVDFGGVRDALRNDGGSTVIGTFGYMAPEQLHGQATPATDIYSLGATIVALAGKVDPEDVPRKGLRMDLSNHLSRLSPGFVEVLERMTAPNPEARPQSASEVLRLLPDQAPGVLRKSPATRASRPKPAPPAGGPAATAAPPRAKDGALAPKPVDDPYIIELDESMPAPLRAVLGVMFGIVGVAGVGGLWMVQHFFLPIAFTIISAFVSAESRQRLRSSKAEAQKSLGEGQAGFRRLAEYGFGGQRRRQLPPGK